MQMTAANRLLFALLLWLPLLYCGYHVLVRRTKVPVESPLPPNRAPSNWTCPENFWYDGVCDCQCGQSADSVDIDCKLVQPRPWLPNTKATVTLALSAASSWYVLPATSRWRHSMAVSTVCLAVVLFIDIAFTARQIASAASGVMAHFRGDAMPSHDDL